MFTAHVGLTLGTLRRLQLSMWTMSPYRRANALIRGPNTDAGWSSTIWTVSCSCLNSCILSFPIRIATLHIHWLSFRSKFYLALDDTSPWVRHPSWKLRARVSPCPYLTILSLRLPKSYYHRSASSIEYKRRKGAWFETEERLSMKAQFSDIAHVHYRSFPLHSSRWVA